MGRLSSVGSTIEKGAIRAKPHVLNASLRIGHGVGIVKAHPKATAAVMGAGALGEIHGQRRSSHTGFNHRQGW